MTTTINNSTGSGGVSFLGLLTLLFIGLKLGKVIAWSWWLVLIPTIGPAMLALFILLIVAIFTR